MDKYLATSVVGVYPKPEYLPTPVWYVEGKGQFTARPYEEYMNSLSLMEKEELRQVMEKAQQEVIYCSNISDYLIKFGMGNYIVLFVGYSFLDCSNYLFGLLVKSH